MDILACIVSLTVLVPAAGGGQPLQVSDGQRIASVSSGEACTQHGAKVAEDRRKQLGSRYQVRYSTRLVRPAVAEQ